MSAALERARAAHKRRKAGGLAEALGSGALPQPWTGHRAVVPVSDEFVEAVRSGTVVEFSTAPSPDAPRVRGQLNACQLGPTYYWNRFDMEGRNVGSSEVREDEVAALVRRLVDPRLIVLDAASAWALFDGFVRVTAAILDSTEPDPAARLLAELIEARAALAAATTAFQRAAIGERIRTLMRRIEARRATAPVRLQNRDRSTAASIAQVKSIAANPDPDLLGFSKTATDGAPIVFADYDEIAIPAAQLGRRSKVTFAKDMSKIEVQYAVVEAGDVMVSHDANGAIVEGYDAPEAPGKLRTVAGNGRAAGIKLAWDRGTADGYKAGLIEDADLLGIGLDVIAAMERPILVRIMTHADVTADIGDKTNTTGMASLSAVEQATNDAARVDFDRLSFNEDGTPTIEALTQFVRSMTQAEQANLAPDGTPTTQALDRFMAATFSRAYQNDDLVKLYSQSLDPEIKNVLFGMAQAAGDMAALAGKGGYDIRQYVTDAAGMAANAKRAGQPLSRMAEQRDMAMPEASNDIAAMFARHARSVKKIGEALRAIAREALSVADAPDEDMFGPVEKLRPGEIIAKAAAVE